MVNLSSGSVDRVFHALADSTRRQMLGRLTRGEASVSELADPFAMSLAAASKHVKVLASAELIVVEKRGRSRMCKLRAGGLREVSDIIAHYQRFWGDRLDALDAHLKREPEHDSESSSNHE